MKIAIIGAGAWGTALSIALTRHGKHSVHLWAFEKEVVESIQRVRINQAFLPGHEIPKAVTATGDLEAALKDAELLVGVMPSHHCPGFVVERNCWIVCAPSFFVYPCTHVNA